MGNQVSTRLYFPYPQNQSFAINRNFNALYGFAESSVYFGILSDSVSSFSHYSMQQESCNTNSSLMNSYASYLAQNICYDSSSIPVTYSINNIATTIEAVFDSGGTVTDIWTSNCDGFSLANQATLPWANNLSVSTTQPASCRISTTWQKSNLGVNVFTGHVVYYSESGGIFAIK